MQSKLSHKNNGKFNEVRFMKVLTEKFKLVNSIWVKEALSRKHERIHKLFFYFQVIVVLKVPLKNIATCGIDSHKLRAISDIQYNVELLTNCMFSILTVS